MTKESSELPLDLHDLIEPFNEENTFRKDILSRTTIHYRAVTAKEGDPFFNELRRAVKSDSRLHARIIGPDTKDAFNYTPLHYAQNSHIAKEMLQLGYSCDAIGRDGSTPLHLAIIRGHLNVAEELLNVSLREDPIDFLRMTPLHWAASQGSRRAIELLQRNGASLHSQDFRGRTPLHLAAMGPNFSESTYVLLRGNGVEFGRLTKECGSPILSAILAKDAAVRNVEILLRCHTNPQKSGQALEAGSSHADKVSPYFNMDMTLRDANDIHYAAIVSNVELLRTLRKYGARFPDRVMGIAIGINAMHAVHFLLTEYMKDATLRVSEESHGCSVWKCGTSTTVFPKFSPLIEWTPSAVALRCLKYCDKNLEIIRMLESEFSYKLLPLSSKLTDHEFGNAQRFERSFGIHDLALYVMRNHTPAKRIYSTTNLDKQQNTYLEMVQYVLNHQIFDISLVFESFDSSGSPRQSSIILEVLKNQRSPHRQPELLNFLVSHCGAISCIKTADEHGRLALYYLCEPQSLYEFVGINEALRRNNVSIHERESTAGRSLLHEAVYAGNMRLVVELIEHIDHRFYRNLTDFDGRTPLHIAAYIYHIDIATYLVYHDEASIYARDNSGDTPLHLFAALKSETFSLSSYHKSTYTESLLQKWADLLSKKEGMVDAQNYRGQTPLHIFCHHITLQNLTEELALERISSFIFYFSPNVHAVDRFSRTVLHYLVGACGPYGADYPRRLRAVSLLVNEYGVDPISSDSNGLTFAHTAFDFDGLSSPYPQDYMDQDSIGSAKSAVTGFSLLLRTFDPQISVALVNKADNTGRTILHYVGSLWLFGMGLMIISDFNSNPNATDHYGRGVLHYVFQTRFRASLFKTEHPAAMKQFVCLLADSEGFDVNAKDCNGQTMLHYIAKYTPESLTREPQLPEDFYLEDPNVTLASYLQRLKTVLQLINVDATIKDNQGKTALDLTINEQLRTTIAEFRGEQTAQGNSELEAEFNSINEASTKQPEMVKLPMLPTEKEQLQEFRDAGIFLKRPEDCVIRIPPLFNYDVDSGRVCDAENGRNPSASVA